MTHYPRIAPKGLAAQFRLFAVLTANPLPPWDFAVRAGKASALAFDLLSSAAAVEVRSP